MENAEQGDEAKKRMAMRSMLKKSQKGKFNNIQHPIQQQPLYNLETYPYNLPVMPIQQYSPPTTCVHPQQQSPVVMNASCFPIKGKKFNERSVALPSSEIKKENLLSSDIVIKKYPKLRHSFGKLAVKLAKESQHMTPLPKISLNSH